jgi:sugar/nucleoside kinase (ribokinase family)
MKESRVALDVITIGALNVDLLITGSAPTDLAELTQWIGPSQVTITAAGANGYATLALAKLGLRTGVVGILADDVWSDLVERELEQTGVDVSHITRQPQTLSGIGIYVLLFGSKKRPLTYRFPTHVPWSYPLASADRDFLLSGRHIHCAGYLHFPDMWNGDLAQLYQEAQARGVTTSFDPQSMLTDYEGAWIEPLREILKYTDLLLVNDQEASRLADHIDLITAARVLQQAGPRIVVIKNGPDGTVVYSEERLFVQPAIAVPEEEIVDAVGAGDAFDAAFVAACLWGWPLERGAKFASVAAASSLRGVGAVSSLASREELERRLDDNP